MHSCLLFTLEIFRSHFQKCSRPRISDEISAERYFKIPHFGSEGTILFLFYFHFILFFKFSFLFFFNFRFFYVCYFFISLFFSSFWVHCPVQPKSGTFLSSFFSSQPYFCTINRLPIIGSKDQSLFIWQPHTPFEQTLIFIFPSLFQIKTKNHQKKITRTIMNTSRTRWANNKSLSKFVRDTDP